MLAIGAPAHQQRKKKKMFKFIQKYIISLYRLVALTVLITIIIGVISYLALLIIYGSNRSWAAPLILSPSQERVLAFQPQIANLEANLNKQRVDLETAKLKIRMSTEQANETRSLISRLKNAQQNEAKEMRATGKAFNSALSSKKSDISMTNSLIKDSTLLLSQIDQELKAKLITSDQAMQRRMSIQSAMNSATDAKTQAVQITSQARQLNAGATTFSGGSSSVSALVSVQQLQQLNSIVVEAEAEIHIGSITVESLSKTIADGERILAVAKTSPYFKALREPVNVLFIPYTNLVGVKVSDPIYDCYLQVLICRKVGNINTIYKAEEYARHPLFKTDLKGQFANITFTDPSATESSVVFIGGKPLLF